MASRAAALKKCFSGGAGFDRKRADQTLTLINEALDTYQLPLAKAGAT